VTILFIHPGFVGLEAGVARKKAVPYLPSSGAVAVTVTNVLTFVTN
jgi:hypothetical protein